MSRSRKKVSAYSGRAGGMSAWKRCYNKRIRHAIKQQLNNTIEWDDLVLPHRYELSSVFESPHDGGVYIDWKKPDNDECIRDWCRHGSEDWYFNKIIREWVHKPLVDNHYEETNSWYDDCSCLRNTNSLWWRTRRK